MRYTIVAVAGLALVGCGQEPAQQNAPSAAQRSGPTAPAEALLDQGRVDEALEALEGIPSTPAAILLQGRIWARKAEMAPPPEPPEEGGDPPHYKLEELNALAFYDTVVPADPDHGANPEGWRWPARFSRAPCRRPGRDRSPGRSENTSRRVHAPGTGEARR